MNPADALLTVVAASGIRLPRRGLGTMARWINRCANSTCPFLVISSDHLSRNHSPWAVCRTNHSAWGSRVHICWIREIPRLRSDAAAGMTEQYVKRAHPEPQRRDFGSARCSRQGHVYGRERRDPTCHARMRLKYANRAILDARWSFAERNADRLRLTVAVDRQLHLIARLVGDEQVQQRGIG